MQVFYVLGAWGISDVRSGHCPLKVHGPDTTLPQEIQELGGGVWSCWASAEWEGAQCYLPWSAGAVLLGNPVGRGHVYWVWVGTSKKPPSSYFFTFGAHCLILSQLATGLLRRAFGSAGVGLITEQSCR